MKTNCIVLHCIKYLDASSFAFLVKLTLNLPFETLDGEHNVVIDECLSRETTD